MSGGCESVKRKQKNKKLLNISSLTIFHLLCFTFFLFFYDLQMIDSYFFLGSNLSYYFATLEFPKNGSLKNLNFNIFGNNNDNDNKNKTKQYKSNPIIPGKEGGDSIFSPEKPFKVKANIPEAWLESPCSRLLIFFLENLNKKIGDSLLSPDELEIKCGGLVLQGTDIIGKHIHEYNELTIVHKKVTPVEQSSSNEVRCTNFGCGMLFDPAVNDDTLCHFHSQGPVFHDLEKHWACCPTHKAFDWEEFQQLPTCQVGKHSTNRKPFVYPQEQMMNKPLQPTANVSAQANEVPQPVRRSTGPREFEGAMASHPEQKIVNGKAKCRNFGCNKEFFVEENNDTACTFHSGGPVIWDTQKYWQCCPHRKCYEFEDFQLITNLHCTPHKCASITPNLKN
eukprot:gene11791-8102_t